MLDRRELLSTVAIAGVGATLPGLAAAQGIARNTQLRATVDRFADKVLALSPEQATGLGLDKGARADLKSRLNDRSEEARTTSLNLASSMRAQLAAVPRSVLSGPDLTLYDTVTYALDLSLAARPFAYGDNGFAPLGAGAEPYPVTQQNGDYNQVPEFLDSQHQIETRADADAYLARLDAFGPALAQESACITADAARNVIPPSFILATTLTQLRGIRATPAAKQKMVTSIATRTAAKGIAGDWAARATRIVESRVYPALDGQIAVLDAVRASADDRAGVWRLPEGDAYYAWALKCGTTTLLTADAVHRTGMAQTAELQARMDGLLRKQGMTKGRVGERLSALTRDPRYIYPNTDEGRAATIAYVQGRIDAIRPLLPRMSAFGLRADLKVKRVPEDIQDGAALGYMNFASLDGARPAIYYINLKDNGNWPRWTLATLTAHEGVPGHAFQGAYLAEHAAELPTIVSLMGFNAFVEGWALYSEQLVDELGLYADDPLGQLGELQALNFRAARLVVDTGLHSKRWTRAQAIDWMVANTGRARTAVTSEVDRYCVAPGQACGYKIGHNEILRLRAKAQAELGARFDLRGFDDAIVTTGGVPLQVLASVVDRWAATRRA